METKGHSILRFLFTGALDEAIWGWAVRGAVVGIITALKGWSEGLPSVAVFVYSFWAFIGVVFLLAGLKWSFRVMPKKAIDVEFFEERPNQYWYRKKIESARVVWAAYLGGGSMHAAEILNSNNFRRLIFLDPDSSAYRAMWEMESQLEFSDLQDIVLKNTERAKNLNCEVRWCKDTAYSLLTIGNPPRDGGIPPNDMWVIIENYIVGIEAEKRPSIYAEWSKNPGMVGKALTSFHKLWEHSNPVPSDLQVPHKEDSQT
jgi:hypothetical protein